MTDTMADDRQPILAHLEEFRWRIVKIAAAIFAGAMVALLFANRIRLVLEAPYEQVCGNDCALQSLTATEQFSVLMKVAVFGGFVLASPVVLYQLWAFINPALTTRERRWAVPIISACVVLFLAGISLGYWILPRGLEFLLGIFPDVESNLRLGEYFSFVVRFLLAFGGSFLYPVFLFAAAAAGLVSSSQLARGRRWAILIIVVVAAAITPTGDALTLTLLSVPLYLFYEVTYWLVRLILRK